MTNKESKMQRRAMPQMNIHPPRRVSPALGGYRAVPFQTAVRCWAKMLERATFEVQDQLTPIQWAYLAIVLEGTEKAFEPERDNPAFDVAQEIDRAIRYKIGDELLGEQAAVALRGSIMELGYVHCWAVLWAVQYYWRHHQEIGDTRNDIGEQWWTLAHRQRMAQLKGEYP